MKRKLQVFISSTYSDLRDERQAAVEAILKAGHIPAGMELFTAGDKSQMKTIEAWIDESDVCMLILGGRYGSIEPSTGLSYVELEYNYAVTTGKPTFAVVISEASLEKKVKIHGTNILKRADPKALAQFREKVLKNISSFFEDTKDIKLCIHESLSDYEANPDLKGWVSADDLQDTKSLQDEIVRLRQENETLTERLRVQSTPARQTSEKERQELMDLLLQIEVIVPEKLTKGAGDVTMDLLNLAYNNRERLIRGITNSIGASDADAFFYNTVFPKLQAHALADNEKVPGVRYRRSFLNRNGLRFFAEMEKDMLLRKKNKRDIFQTETSLSSQPPVADKTPTNSSQSRKKEKHT